MFHYLHYLLHIYKYICIDISIHIYVYIYIYVHPYIMIVIMIPIPFLWPKSTHFLGPSSHAGRQLRCGPGRVGHEAIGCHCGHGSDEVRAAGRLEIMNFGCDSGILPYYSIYT